MVEERYSLALWDSPPRAQIEVAALPRSAVQDITIDDKAVGHVCGTDSTTLPSLGRDLETFGSWYSVASTLYNKLYQITQFDPSTMEYSATAFANLRYSFSSSPYWSNQFSIVSRDVTISPQDYGSVVRVIHDFSNAIEITQNVEAQIIANVKKIAQLASTPGELSQKRTLFYNATIANTTGIIHILLLYAAITLEMDQQKGRYQGITQDIKVVMGHGTIDIDFCKRHASNILGYSRQSIEVWQDQAAANSQAESASEGWPADT